MIRKNHPTTNNLISMFNELYGVRIISINMDSV